MIQSKLTVIGMLTRFAFFALNTGILYMPILLIKDNALILEWIFSILVTVFFVIISPITILITRKISIDHDKIAYTNWLTGKVKIYNFKDLDGYITIIKPRRIIGVIEEDFESIILIKENKRIGEISSYYYFNYDELIDGLKDVKHLGQVDNNTFNSFKNYFNELFK